ncbi:MAG: histidine--tRNA ligase [Acidimicrobiia bacterium]|jgi:histidyl-tRNA synthetase|nr:histidine--tRNA ligase [Acidimicrobiia bacterium]
MTEPAAVEPERARPRVEAFRAPKGTRDLLPPASTRTRRLVAAFATLAEQAGYGEVVVPMFEELGVFSRLGEATDVVTKEMYDFIDKGGRRIALRPEQTAPVVRAFVEHRPPAPWKVWYAGPNFRYERPQKGRYRQFDQVGVEVLGVDDPQADVEVIALAWRFYAALGLRQVVLKLNSLGDVGDRARYAEVLRAHFEGRAEDLSAAARETLERNPLRLLDSKRPEDAAAVAVAPSILDGISAAAAAHLDEVRAGLDALAIPYVLEPRLVRGLDYYRRTTFEFAGDALDGAQDALGGGGRYDGLVEALGGPPTPGIGFALGVDRVLLACDAEATFPAPPTALTAFVIDTTGGREATSLCEALRAAGIGADRAWDGRSLKAQMKAAGQSGAAVAVIIGTSEVADGAAVVRDLRASEQAVVRRGDVIDHVRKLVQRP